MFLFAALASVAIQNYFMIFYELMWIYWNYFHSQIIYFNILYMGGQKYLHKTKVYS